MEKGQRPVDLVIVDATRGVNRQAGVTEPLH
jgi:hypothetical protein